MATLYGITIRKDGRRVFVWNNKSAGSLAAYQTKAAAKADAKKYLKGRAPRVVKLK